MKRFIYILAVTSITVMLSASFESQAQNRRSTSSTNRQTTAVKPSASRTVAVASERNSQPKARPVDPKVKHDARVATRVVKHDAARHTGRAYRPEPVRHRNVIVRHEYRPASVYYRPRRHSVTRVVVRRPPIGHRVTMMDVALTAVVLNSIDNTIDKIIAAQAAKDAKYYYNNGTYYKYDNGEYEVINAPEGALISELPDDAYEIELNGKTYYQVGDDLYKVVLVEGHPFFEVVARI